MSGQTTFVTDGASGAAGTVTVPESCVDPAPVVSTARNIGNTTTFSDAAPSDNGC
jgi:ssDNA-binding replication factor A large subunit